jgi:hypothetical protein
LINGFFVGSRAAHANFRRNRNSAGFTEIKKSLSQQKTLEEGFL